MPTIRTLSSDQTKLMKWIVPVLWIVFFGAGALDMIFGSSDHPGSAPPFWMKVEFAVLGIAGIAFVIWAGGRLKRVRMDDAGLLVSNFRQEIRIPFEDIQTVTENRWINIHPVTIRLRRSTPFGDRIVFMPKMQFTNWRQHPVVAELRTRVGIQ